MQIRAAVLEEFGKPLVVQEIGLDGPKAGEVLVRVQACGVCHTDMYTASGVDPTGYAPTVLGHEGAGVVEAIGEGVTSLKPGDHVLTLFSPQCRECMHCTSRQDEHLPRDPRRAGAGLPARPHDAAPPRRRAHPPLHGDEHVRRGDGDARDRAREGAEGGAARRPLHARLRRDDRDRRGALHREGRAGQHGRRVRRGARRPRRGRRARSSPAPSGSSSSTRAPSGARRPSSWARPTSSRAATTSSSRSSS